MFKVLAIMGSPRKKGNTYRITKMVEESLKQYGDVEVEYLFLKDANLQTCLGCRACMDRGEELCPLKDDRASIEQKILAADGIIVACPTYVGNVTGLTKDFIDRFAYVCHRPSFFKNAMMITTSGGGGGNFMLLCLSIALGTWGMEIASKLSVVTHEQPTYNTPAEKEVHDRAVAKKVDFAANKFYRSLQTGFRPNLMSMARFQLTRQAHLKDIPGSPDYQYWKSKGWYEKGTYYFYDTHAGPIKKGMALAGSRLLGLLAR